MATDEVAIKSRSKVEAILGHSSDSTMSNREQIGSLLKPAYLDLQYHKGQDKPNRRAINQIVKLAKATPIEELRAMLWGSADSDDLARYYILHLNELVQVFIDRGVFDQPTIFSLQCDVEQLQFSLTRIKALSKNRS
jgi:hypothetical protein